MRRRPVAHCWLLAVGVWHAAVWLLTWPADALLRAELRRIRVSLNQCRQAHTEAQERIVHLQDAIGDLHSEIKGWQLRMLDRDAGER